MSAGDRTPFSFAPLPPLTTAAGANYDSNLLSPTTAGWRSPASTAGTDPNDFELDLDFDLDLPDLGAWPGTLSPAAPLAGFNMLERAIGEGHSGASPLISGLNLGPLDEMDAAYTTSAKAMPDDGIGNEDIFGMELDMSTAWPPMKNTAPAEPSSVTSAPFFTAASLPTVTVSSFSDNPPVRRFHSLHDGLLPTFSGSSDVFTDPLTPEFAPSPSPAAAMTRLSRVPSLKRRRSKWDCTAIETIHCGCSKAERPKPGQKKRLDMLPPEILLIIFEYAYLTPDKPKGCHHENGNIEGRVIAGITRRATTGSIGASRPWIRGSSFLNQVPVPASSSSNMTTATSMSTEEPSTMANVDSDEPDAKTEELRIYRAKTLLNIMLTCRNFYNMLAADPGTDDKFWKTAARWCWEWLPDQLSHVQGSNYASQTSWRNLVAVFMRSENGLFGKKNGGKGGVESFGGRREGKDALTWNEFQALKRSRDGKRRKVVLVCAQPGPDVFAALPREDGDGWILSLSIRNHPLHNAVVYLDRNGDFGRCPGRLSPDLKRNPRCPDYFQPDIFAVEGERMKLLKVSHDGLSPHGVTRVEWDLSVIQEMITDSQARPARAVSHRGRLLCNLYTHGVRDATEFELLQLLDPPENSTIYCLQAPLTEQNPASLSLNQLGKRPSSRTELLWRRDFTYPQAADFDPSQSLHSVICNLSLTADHAVALVRWNITSPESAEEFVDRAFHILSPVTGETIRTLEFPHLYWDYRHHDMSAYYNNIRLRKLQRLFNHLPPGTAVGAGNRCTRIHNDRFLITGDGRLLSGSHDYCNWVWDLKREGNKQKGVYTDTRNDAGKYDDFEVLDDYYWSTQSTENEQKKPTSTELHDTTSTSQRPQPQTWNSTSERAGWWVRTPNQVLCFWHNIALSGNHALFAACRPGKLFLWDLDNKNPNDNIMGFQYRPGKDRWMGKLAKTAEGLRSRLARWFVWGGVMPKQGLWIVVEEEDGNGEGGGKKELRTVFVDRKELLKVTGVGGRWEFGTRDFVIDDEEEAIDDDDDDDNDDEAMEYTDTDTESEDETGDVIGGMVGTTGRINGRSEDGDAERRKRRRVSSSASVAQWDDELDSGFTFAAEGEQVI